MDALWHLKFYSMIPIPGNQISLYFDDGNTARTVIDRHAAGLANKPAESCEVISFDDLLGHHCFRPDFFPYAALFEVGVADAAWKEIDEKIKAVHRSVDGGNKTGFQPGGPKNETDDD